MTESFDDWLVALRDRRRGWVEANRRNDFDRGIRNATVEKYADAAHFVFELLQNAEDAGATRATFLLGLDAVSFEHDGRPFERPDIEGVTGLGNTTKLGEANRIGCFGIGFKSVFVVTDAPEVHSYIEGRPVAFAIRDLVVPQLIASAHAGPGTLIRLPLAANRAGAILARVRAMLDEAGPRSLLFLSSLRVLAWGDGAGGPVETRVEDDGNVRTIVTTGPGRQEARDRFVVLERTVERNGEGQLHSVKAALRLNAGGEVVPEPGAGLAVFFDTEDATGLQFQVHGPFQLTDNRANAKRNDPWNMKLVREIGAMIAGALPALRDRGFVTRQFLDVVPGAGDQLPAAWTPVRDAIHAAFRTQALLPAHGGGHVAANRAVRGPADLREALGDSGLAAFAGLLGRRWAVGGIRGSRAEALLSTLDVAEFGVAELLEAFKHAFERWRQPTPVRDSAQAWFDSLPDDQVQRLYLVVEQATRGKPRGAIATCEFVRLENGSRALPEQARLPPAGSAADPEAATLGPVLVRGTLIRPGRGRGTDVEQFLRRAGVAEIGERDYLEAMLARSYRVGAAPPAVEAHLRHMRRLMRRFEADGDASLLDGVSFLRVEGDPDHYPRGYA